MLDLHRQIYGIFGERVGKADLRNSYLNSDGCYFPSGPYDAADILTITNFSAMNRQGDEIWMEVACFVEKNGIPLATVSSPLYDEPVLFLAEREAANLLALIDNELTELSNWN